MDAVAFFHSRAALIDEVGDAVGDDARFAGAGAGQDQHRPVDRFDGLTLLGIQFVEQMLQLKSLRGAVFEVKRPGGNPVPVCRNICGALLLVYRL